MARQDPWEQFADAPSDGFVAGDPQNASAPAAPANAPAAAPGQAVDPQADAFAQFGDAPQGAQLDTSGTQYQAGFADELPTQPVSRLPDEDHAKVVSMLQAGDFDGARQFAASKGFTITDIDAIKKAYEQTGRINPDATYSLPKVEVDAPGALARGVTDTVLSGTLPKLGAGIAGIESALSGNGFSDAYNRQLDQNNATIGADEQDHPWLRVAGQLLGGLLLPAGLEDIGLKAGTDVLRAGGSMTEARAAAQIAVRNRMAAVGGAYGVAHGAGSADSIPDAVTGGLVEGSLGAATGGLLGQAGRSAPKTDEAASTALNDGAEVYQAAVRQGVNVMPQDVGGPTIQRMTAGAAQTPFGARTIKESADKLYNSFRDRVGAIGGDAGTAADVGGTLKARSERLAAREGDRAGDSSAAIMDASGVPVDETSAGQIAQRGVARWMTDTAGRATQLYNAVPIPAERPATVSNTRRVLSDVTAQMESNPQLSAMFQNPRLRGYLEALTPDTRENPTGLLDATGRSMTRSETVGGDLSWRDLQEFRTRVGDMLDEPRLAEKIAPRQLRALYGALTQDMQATARAEGPQAYRAWQRANNYYDGRMKRIKDTISIVTGERTDRTPNEAISALNGLLKTGSTGDANAFGRIMRTLPTTDAASVRATIVQNARGGREFDPAAFAKNWGSLSERGKSALLPMAGARQIMDDAASRAAAASRDPLEGKSGEQAFLALERMASNRGDSTKFRASLAALSPEEANATRALMIHRMGLATAGAQTAEGDAFSIGKFLTRWNEMTPEAKVALFGNAEMRSNMNDLAMLAERVKGSEKLAGHSNTGAVNSFNATTGGLGGAVLALVTGHPIVAAGLAAPAAYQRLSAEALTSQRLLNWLVRSPKKPNPAAEMAHVKRLTAIARAEPAIANEVLQLQQRLMDHFAGAPLRAAASPDESLNGQRNASQQKPQQQGAQP